MRNPDWDTCCTQIAGMEKVVGIKWGMSYESYQVKG